MSTDTLILKSKGVLNIKFRTALPSRGRQEGGILEEHTASSSPDPVPVLSQNLQVLSTSSLTDTTVLHQTTKSSTVSILHLRFEA